MAIDISKIKKAIPLKEHADNKDLLGVLNKELSFGNSFKDKKKERFYSELSMLLSSGIDVKTALELVIEGEKNKKNKMLFEEITERVVGGYSLSEAVKMSNKFSDYEYYSLKIGEESGDVTVVLNDLARYYSKRIEQKRKLVSAFSYPAIVTITAIGTVIFMLRFIVPMFEDVFKRFGGKLPFLTEMIIGFSESVGRYGIWIFSGFLSITIIIFFQRKKEWMRRYGAAFMSKIPLIGNLIEKTYIARFCHAMALLTEAKNPLLHSIQLARKMVGYYPLEKALEKIEIDILNGCSLHQSMRAFSLFEPKIISLIKVAEEVNQLDKIFNQLNKQYSEEVEHRTQVLSSLLEPILIVLIGVFVALILIAMYLPLFQLSSGI